MFNIVLSTGTMRRPVKSLQRQHFLLSYLKTPSVGPAGIWTRDLPYGQSGALPTEPTGRRWKGLFFSLHEPWLCATHLYKLQGKTPVITQLEKKRPDAHMNLFHVYLNTSHELKGSNYNRNNAQKLNWI